MPLALYIFKYHLYNKKVIPEVIPEMTFFYFEKMGSARRLFFSRTQIADLEI